MNFTQSITRHARKRPWAIAIIDRDRIVHYRTFDVAIDRAAAWLKQYNVSRGDVVGISMPGSALHLVVAYALSRIGAIQLALMHIDTVPARQALIERFRIEKIVGSAPDLTGVTTLEPRPEWLEPADRPDDSPFIPEPEAQGFRINLSSGTTGRPKAVLITHAINLQLFEREQAFFPLLENDRYLATVDLAFASGLRRCMESLNAGATIVLAPRLDDPATLSDMVDRYRITIVMLTIGTLGSLLTQAPDDGPRWPGVRLLRVGSSVMPESMRHEVIAKLTSNFVISYGTNHIGNVAFASATLQAKHPETVGYPGSGVDIEVVNEANMPLAPGLPGLIRVRTSCLPGGYLDDPDATARDFRDGWYYPGDIGILTQDGALLFKGRLDDVINYDGLKIFPIEIERVLLMHSDVAEAVAFALPSRRFNNIPAAAVVLRRHCDLNQILAYCQDRLGIRAPLRIHAFHTLPKNAMGKVLRRELVKAIVRHNSSANPTLGIRS